MKKMLINATQADELRVAITTDSILSDLDVEKAEIQQKKANIYKGKITSIEPSLAAVFVNFGSERHGFLPLKEISPDNFSNYDPNSDEPIDINKVLKVGQPIVIQVEKEERGTKGAALTSYLSLAGSYLVLMPNNPRAGGISRRIEGDERDQLRETLSQLKLPEGMGVIIRTAGVSKTADELQWDLDVLLRYYEAIKQAVSMNKAGPYLIHQESDVVIRTLRDYLRQDIEEVVIDERSAFERAQEYIAQVRPSFTDRIKFYQNVIPLFSRYQIEQQIETAYQREIRLPSGGSIVIDQTEALVSIDINSARATKGKSIEETALNTNKEAAEEIARQLRLRDIGGLIVIDFIDMTQTRNQRDVENALREYLRMDRARIQIGRISRFGLLEMSRQRLRSGINKASRIPCPRCSGTGSIRSVESLAISIIHLIQEQAAKTDKQIFQIQVPVDVATFLINEQRDKLASIEQHTGVHLTIVPNQHIQTPHYHIRHLKKTADGQSKQAVPSYKLLRQQKTEGNSKQNNTKKPKVEEPVINQFLSNDKPKRQASKAQSSEPGLVRRIINKLFSPEVEEEKKPEPAKKRQNRRGSQQRGHNNRQRQEKGGQQRQNNRSRNNNNRNNNSSRSNTEPRDKNQDSKPQRNRQRKSTQQHDNEHTVEEQAPQKRAQSSSAKPKQTRRGSRGGQSNRSNRSHNKPSTETAEKNQAQTVDRSQVDNIKATKPSSPQVAELARENQVNTPAKAPELKTQNGVEQKPMKAGRRISPMTKKPEEHKPKPAYKPGRKIASAGEKQAQKDNGGDKA